MNYVNPDFLTTELQNYDYGTAELKFCGGHGGSEVHGELRDY